MLEAVLFSVMLVVLAVGAYSDIRTREVPDWLNFAGIVAGIGIRALWGVAGNGWAELGYGLLGFIVFFGLATIMYYSGQWGGGDSKLLMAVGTLLGFGFSLKSPSLAFVLWALLAGAAYGVVWSIALAVKNWNSFAKSYGVLSRSVKWAHFPVLAVLALGVAFAIATNDELLRVLMLVVSLVVPLLFYVGLMVKAVENCCMYKFLPVGKLTEGDWIAKVVKVKGSYVCGPKDLGITKEKIEQLKRLRVKEVLVKEGIPFVPSLLVAFVLFLVFGSPLAWFF
ncbi:MAG: A24 family peptidase [Candidatus Woesearchaeota archaeon]